MNFFKAGVSTASANGRAVYSTGVMRTAGTVETSDEIPEGHVLGRIKLQDSYDINVLQEYLESQESPDMRVPVTCEIEYEGDYIFPYVTIVGYNYKKGTAEKYGGDYSKVTKDDIGKTILHYTTTLFPGEYHKFNFMLSHSDINWEDGANFEIEFPIISELAQASDEEESQTSDDEEEETNTPENSEINSDSPALGNSGGGCELGFGSLMIFGLLGLTSALKRR